MTETLQELLIHEAVGDGVAAGGRVREQVHEGNPDGAQRPVHLLGNVETHDVDDEDRRPAEEELEHHHEEHADHMLLGLDALLQVGAAEALKVRLG